MSVIFEGHQDIDDAVAVGQVREANRVLGDQEQQDLLQPRLVLKAVEFGQSLDVGEESDDLPGHLFVGEAQVNDVLQEGEEGERGGERAGLGQLPEESEADLVGEDGQMVVLEDLAGLDDLLAEDGVLLVDVGEDAL